MATPPVKAERIRALAGSNLSNIEIANQVGATKEYVSEVLRRDKQKGEAEAAAEGKVDSLTGVGVGSDMAALRDFIRESSSTQKVDAIIRAFANRNPDDHVGLARLLQRARVPVADQSFIVQSWAAHRGRDLTNLEVDKIIGASRTNPPKKGSKYMPVAEEESDSVLDSQAQMLDDQIEFLQKQQKLDFLKSTLASFNDPKSSVEPAMVKQTRKVLRVDAEGKPLRDDSGNMLYDIIEEEHPYYQNQSGPLQPQQQTDPNLVNVLMQNQQRSQQESQNLMNTLFMKMLDQPKQTTEKDNTELLMKMMDNQRDYQMDMLRNSHGKDLDEVKALLKEKEMQDEFGGHIGQLQEELRNLQQSNVSDERYKLMLQSDLTKTLISELRGVKDSTGGVFSTLAREMAEDRRHLRHLEQLKAAQTMGLDPREFQEQWQGARVPTVSDQDFEMIMTDGE